MPINKALNLIVNKYENNVYHNKSPRLYRTLASLHRTQRVESLSQNKILKRISIYWYKKLKSI